MPLAMHVSPVDYRVGRRLSSGLDVEVYEAVREADGVDVVLKAYLSGSSTARLRTDREFQALKRAVSPGVPQALALIRNSDPPVLVLERLRGVPLEGWLAEPATPIKKWFDIAIRLAEALSPIHAARIVHKNLTPRNILADPGSGRLWIIGFGLATSVGATDDVSSLRRGIPSHSLQYFSPEQTGRMNRGCDLRSDLYSLGAVLYFAACGAAPFRGKDPLELIHAQMALLPTPPVQVRPDLPEPISKLITKLLSKQPEERYQSVGALLADLRHFREELGTKGSLPRTLELGKHDIPLRPRSARQLHGRDLEIASLRGAYLRAANGQARLVLLSGEPGAGKSTLVEALRRQVAQSGGYLAAGKFDGYSDRAYAGWVGAFSSLAQQMLVESDARLEYWRDALNTSLGSIARVLVDLVPDLGFVLGDVPPVPILQPNASRARVSLAVQRLIVACATESHPLVLFLDDLQWSDAGSLGLLEELLSSVRSAPVLVIGAYRAAQVHLEHPLSRMIVRLESRDVPLEQISLETLDLESIASMLSEMLERAPHEVRDLAARILRTGGCTPLLVQQFVEHLHERGWLRYTHDCGWTWDDVEIEQAEIPESAIALLTARIHKLPVELQAILQRASCIGDQFDASRLAMLSETDAASLEAPLFALTHAGLISLGPTGFRFSHDRIRETARSLLSSDRRARLHGEMAQILLESTAEADLPEHCSEISDHLNRGREYLPEHLRLRALQVNLLAGKRALAAGAGSTATTYLDAAHLLFRESDWEEQRGLALDMYLQRAASGVQCGEFSQVLALLETVERHQLNDVEHAQAAAVRIRVLALTRPPEEGARYALAALRKLGVRWPLHPSRLRAWIALHGVQWRLGSSERVQALRPASAVRDTIAQVLVIGSAGGLLSRTDRRLVTLATCHVLKLHLTRGYVVGPAYAFAALSLYAYLLFGDEALARRHIQSALHWMQRVPDAVYDPRTELTIHLLLNPWLQKRRDALELAPHIAEHARQTGDREFEYYTLFLDACYRALGGDPIRETEERLRKVAASVEATGHVYAEPSAVHEVYRLLLSELTDRDIENGLAESDNWLRKQTSTVNAYVRTFWLLFLCVRGRYDLALRQSEALGAQLRSVDLVHMADHLFYRGLAAAVLAGTLGDASAASIARSSLKASRGSADGPEPDPTSYT